MTKNTKSWTKDNVPKSPGRPRATKNTDIKESLKKFNSEAVNNVVNAMRFNEERCKELMRRLVQTELWIEEAKEIGDEEAVEKYEKRYDHIVSRLEKQHDTTVKYSLKFMDYAYKIVLHEETLTIQRKKLNTSGKKSDDDEDGDMSYSSPVVSLRPVER